MWTLIGIRKKILTYNNTILIYTSGLTIDVGIVKPIGGYGVRRRFRHGAGSDADGEFTSGEGRHAVRSPVFHDGNPDKRRPRLVGNVAPDHELPLRGLRPDFESGEQAQTERQDQSAE